MSDEQTPEPSGEQLSPPSVESRLSALEAAVASLGGPHVSQNHDSLARFRAWLSSYLVRP